METTQSNRLIKLSLFGMPQEGETIDQTFPTKLVSKWRLHESKNMPTCTRRIPLPGAFGKKCGNVDQSIHIQESGCLTPDPAL